MLEDPKIGNELKPINSEGKELTHYPTFKNKLLFEEYKRIFPDDYILPLFVIDPKNPSPNGKLSFYIKEKGDQDLNYDNLHPITFDDFLDTLFKIGDGAKDIGADALFVRKHFLSGSKIITAKELNQLGLKLEDLPQSETNQEKFLYEIVIDQRKAGHADLGLRSIEDGFNRVINLLIDDNGVCRIPQIGKNFFISRVLASLNPIAKKLEYSNNNKPKDEYLSSKTSLSIHNADFCFDMIKRKGMNTLEEKEERKKFHYPQIFTLNNKRLSPIFKKYRSILRLYKMSVYYGLDDPNDLDYKELIEIN